MCITGEGTHVFNAHVVVVLELQCIRDSVWLCLCVSSRTNRDANVVAHNRKMLLLFNGHVNVEFSGTVNLIMYLYKVRQC